MEKRFTISVYTENIVGLLLRITAVFTRRHINIESLTVSETERRGISRFTIVVRQSEDMVNKVTKQINRIVEVIFAEYHSDADLISSQLALFKVDIAKEEYLPSLEVLARQANARILIHNNRRMVLEKTGTRDSLEAFLRDLEAYGEVEYVRSGRIAVTSSSSRLSEIIPKLPELNRYPNYSMDHHN